MKYLKIKVKHIIIFVCVLVIAYIGINYNSPNMYYLLGNINKGTTSNAYYNKLVEEHPQSKKSVLGQIKILEDILKEHQVFNKMIIVLQTGITTANVSLRVLSEDSLKDINDAYYTLLQYHGYNDYFDNYTLCTALVNWCAGNNDTALELLSEKQFKDKDDEALRNMYISLMNIELGNFDKALDLMKKHHDNEYESYWDIVAYYYNILSGKINNESNQEDSIITRKSDKFYIIDELYGDILLSMDIKNKEKSDNTLQGVILSDGIPMENMLVFLTSMDGVSSHIGFLIRKNLVAITDENGQYNFNNIPNGDYNVGLCLPWNRMKGYNIEFDQTYRQVEMRGNDSCTKDINIYSPIKVAIKEIDTNRFQFKVSHDYLDFDYYRVGLGLINGEEEVYNINYCSNTKFRDNTIYFDVDTARKNFFSIGYSSSNGIIYVRSLIDSLHHSGKYYLKITGGYDDNDCYIDNYGSYSNVPITTIDIEGKEWTQGDRLLIDKKFGEAALQYEKELEEDPNDIHIHRTLAKMYMREWDTNDDESNIDYKKALEHLLIINESNPTSAIEEAIGTCYYNLNRYKEAIEYYKKGADNNSYYMMAKSYYYLNDYNNAIESYSRLIGSNINDAAIERMICIYILQNNIEGLRDVVTKYTNKYNNGDYELLTDRYISMDRSDIIEFYKLINEGDIDKAKRLLDNKNDDIARFYKCIFILIEDTSYESRSNKFMDVYKDIDNNILKDYIENLGDDEIEYYEMHNYDDKNGDMPIQD